MAPPPADTVGMPRVDNDDGDVDDVDDGDSDVDEMDSEELLFATQLRNPTLEMRTDGCEAAPVVGAMSKPCDSPPQSMKA